MDFELSEDQAALAEGVRSFCAGRFPIAVVRDLIAAGGIDRGKWRELADLGLFSLRLAESDGGAGLGWTDAATPDVLVTVAAGRCPFRVADLLALARLVAGCSAGSG